MLSYRSRLRRDLARWQERGFIDVAQRERIAADALAPAGLAALEGALILCGVVLVAAAVVAFVAANWAGIAPPTRLLILFAGNALAVALACAASIHESGKAARPLTDGAATLSLAVAAANVALVAQTFHLPSDIHGFAVTIAGLGVVTALVARSGGAALVAGAALLVAEWARLTDFPVTGPGLRDSLAFAPIAGGLFVGSLAGRLPVRTANLFLVLFATAVHLGAARASILIGVAPDVLLAIAVAALAGGHLLARMPETLWTGHVREAAESLVGAASGLVLTGILASASRSHGFGVPSTLAGTVLACLAFGVAAVFVLRPVLRRRAMPVSADILVLAAAGMALLGSWIGLLIGGRGTPSGLTVWAGLVPCLALVVAGHLEDRRALFVWALVATGGFVLAMLMTSGNLLGFSANLLGSALLVGLTLVVCRRLDRRRSARPS